MQEEWRPVVGYEKWYQVSNLGKIKILAYTTERIRKGKIQQLSVNECISDPPVNATGYRQIELHNRDTKKISTVKICNLVAKCFCELEPGTFTHKDRDTSNDCFDNLVSYESLLDYSQANWKWVKGFEGYYQVSDTGLVRTVKGIYPKQTLSYDGYLQINLSYKGKTKSTSVHRLVAEAFLDEWDSKLEVNHKDGNKQNNSVVNLEIVTHQQNMDHYWKSEVFAEHQKEYTKYAKKAMTERWKNPEFRNKVQSIFNDPEYKKAHSEAGKRVYSDPEMRKKASENSKKLWAANHDKQLAAIKKGWADPEKRRLASERNKGTTYMHTPEGKNVRVPNDEVQTRLDEGYAMGRTPYTSKKCTKVYCKQNNTVYLTMTECDKALGLKDGDTYHILKGPMFKRLIPVQEFHQLSLYTEKDP